MKKAIVVSAIGTEYEILFRKTAPTFKYYAARHGWDLRVVTDLPDGFLERFSRPAWTFRLVCCALRLYEPSMFADYDLLALWDPDVLINPASPCLSEYAERIPKGGLAAVQAVTYAERSLFLGWSRYYYDDFLSADAVAALPHPELHINSGLVVVRPAEVAERWRELIEMDSDLVDEHRLNVYVAQEGGAFLLPERWNVVYPYELARRGYLPRHRFRTRVARRLADRYEARVAHPRWIREILTDVFALHFAATDKRILMDLDIGGRLLPEMLRRGGTNCSSFPR